MTLRQACKLLGIWPIVEIWTKIWSNSRVISTTGNIIMSAKSNFKNLAMKHHPDKGGDHNVYVKIQEAFNMVKDATVNDFICMYREEGDKTDIFYKSGSQECLGCVKWSSIAKTCISNTCLGFKPSASEVQSIAC